MAELLQIGFYYYPCNIIVKEKAIDNEVTKQKLFLTWERNREKIIPPIA